MRQQRIAVVLESNKRVSRRTQVPAPNPTRWSEEDARVFVRSVWDLLEAHSAESFEVSEIQPWTIYALKFVADRGAATSEPMTLSMRALGWLRAASLTSDGAILH